MSGQAHAASAPDIEWSAPGQVIRYTSERFNRWCREGWAISDDQCRFRDTYWMSMNDAHIVTAFELSTAQHQFWLDDYRELYRYRRGTPEEWAKYAPNDRQRVPSQHGLQARYFVRIGADHDLRTQLQNASDALDDAARDLLYAQGRRERAEDQLRALQAALDAATLTVKRGAQ